MNNRQLLQNLISQCFFLQLASSLYLFVLLLYKNLFSWKYDIVPMLIGTIFLSVLGLVFRNKLGHILSRKNKPVYIYVLCSLWILFSTIPAAIDYTQTGLIFDFIGLPIPYYPSALISKAFQCGSAELICYLLLGACQIQRWGDFKLIQDSSNQAEN